MKESNTSNSELVALFEKQNAILAEHARIMAQQTAILMGEASTDVVQMNDVVAGVPAVPAAIAPEPVVPAAPKVDVTAKVLETIGSVSAFPISAIKTSQGLAKDLGFDSLMFIDLGSALQSAFSGLAFDPNDFEAETTVADIVAYVEAQIGDSPTIETSTKPTLSLVDTSEQRLMARRV